jgi:hypothetical protein
MLDSMRCVPPHTTSGRLGIGSALAILVLLVHSAHAHASVAVHHPAVLATGEAMHLALGSLEKPLIELIAVDLQPAGCMMLELAGPRVSMLALATVAVAVVLRVVPGLPPRVTMWDVTLNPRPPPGSRRQALLGNFLI